MRYLDDFVAGQSYELGSHTVSAEEIVRFASQWDPQSFHTDPTDAAHSAYGGLIASGWHTASIFMRLTSRPCSADSACLGSPGVDDLAWLAPVRPEDTLFARVTSKKSRPRRPIREEAASVPAVNCATRTAQSCPPWSCTR